MIIRLITSVSVLCMSWGLSVSAQAQTAAGQGATGPQSGSSAVDDIIVTAQKRAQSLSDVGMTINAASGDQLQNAGVTDLSQLAIVAPGFSASVGPLGYPLYSLRGVNFYSNSGASPAAVNAYLDEAPLSYPIMTGGLLLDVERVEVLKGPQGTLFGQNSTGGAINVISAKPTNSFATGALLDANHFGQVRLEGFVSGPISDTLKARVALTTTQFGAWQHDPTTGRENGDQNKFGARLSTEWATTDRLTLSVIGNAFIDRSEIQQLQASLVTPADPTNPAPGLTTYPLATKNRETGIDPNFNTRGNIQTYQAIVRADYKLSENANITSLSNYVNTHSRNPRDSDGMSVPTQQIVLTAAISSFTQEIRLSGDLPSQGITYTVGGNYAHDLFSKDNFTAVYPGYSALPIGTQLSNQFRLTNEAIAAFANVDYEIVNDVTLTGGVRYTNTKQTVQGCTLDGGNGIFAGAINGLSAFARANAGLPAVPDPISPGGCVTLDDLGANPTFLPGAVQKSQKQNNVSWRAGVNYKISPGTLLYGLVSRGYKAGQFPDQFATLSSQIRPVRQEKLTSYEIGAKGSAFDRHLQFSLSGFYYDYRDKQFFTYVQSLIVLPTVINIPKSSVKGFDFDFTARPVDGLTLHGAATYVKTEVNQYVGLNYLGLPTYYSGSEFNLAPPFSANFDAEYAAPVGDGLEGYIGSSGVYNSRTYADLGEPSAFQIKRYFVLDARIGLRSDKGWYASVWARNLNNERYWSNAISFGDGVSRIAGRPRTFGVTIGMRTP
ncbi:TonB-dependent receptor (plasmid) [Sphingobium sp. SJ10-10]|uniref:TonB-dependent receptor n=1 Tax=unclassified Sphingobium TaxID=2611147 RepID=UPI0007703BAB|nr:MULTISPECIES: TonB-dependent receptor [unclassified Sphingobium]AMK26537.1 TonB-dependent receptor [Sphingobium sp. TKS]MEC6699562.1 TonB-dependent receptor [Sphingobium sp. SJ10-10]